MAYTDIVMRHFKSPHNHGQIVNPSAVGEVGNPVCGDIMKIYLKIKRVGDRVDIKKDIIDEIKFETMGCAAAIACSSILTDMAKGLTLHDAFYIEKMDIVKGLGDLPPIKIHCSVLASDGLKVAIQQYLKDQKAEDEYPEIRDHVIKEDVH